MGRPDHLPVAESVRYRWPVNWVLGAVSVGLILVPLLAVVAFVIGLRRADRALNMRAKEVPGPIPDAPKDPDATS